MGIKQNLAGKKFGRLTPIAENGRSKYKSVLWLCKCDCGNYPIVDSRRLNSGNTKSCGCYERDVLLKRNTTHGYAATGKKTAEYNTLVGMKRRCYNKNDEKYPIYGGRGIIICERWLSNFENFLADMGKRPSKDHSIDRIDVNGNYEPGNCRWATRSEQQRNQRTNKWIEHNGKKMIQSDWAAFLNILPSQIFYHLGLGRDFSYIYDKFYPIVAK